MDSCPADNGLSTLFTVMTTLINTQTSEDLGSVSKLKDGAQYDFIIVGAGSAGCVLANRLSENPKWSIILLEAGGEESKEASIPGLLDYNYGSRLDWKYEAMAQQRSCGGEPCLYPRGKVLGGSSVLNSMVYTRGWRKDYDNWAAAGSDGWDFESVLPYFKKSENNMDPKFLRNKKYHSTGGFLPVGQFPYKDDNVQILEKAFLDMGYNSVDLNSDDVEGFAEIQATQKNGERRSTNKAFLEPIRKDRPNLTVVTNVRVIEILIAPEKKTAYGIKYVHERNRGIKGTLLARNEVILSAGVFNSAQLLMLSGIGPRKTLSSLGIPVIQDLKVGYNLHDHPMIPGAFMSLKGNSKLIPKTDKLIVDGFEYQMLKRGGRWAAIGSSQMQLPMKTKYADEYPDVQMFFIPELTSASSMVPICYYDQINIQPLILNPKSRGRVTINSTSPFDQPLIYPNYFRDSRDIDTMIDSFKFVQKLKDSSVLKNAGYIVNDTFLPRRKDLETGGNPYWKVVPRIASFSICHPCCTCKMGPSNDPGSVVDPHLRVHGIQHLRVVDGSIMPTIPSGPTNAAIIMIAEKVSDMIKNTWI